MATTIKLKNSTVLDKAPTTADIAVGELALNCNSGSPAAYIQDSAGGIVQIAGVGSVNTPDATETVKGIAEIATTAEVSAGTNDSTIVTPAKLAAAAPAAQDLQSVCDEGTTTTTGATFGGGTITLSSAGAITTVNRIDSTLPSGSQSTNISAAVTGTNDSSYLGMYSGGTRYAFAAYSNATSSISASIGYDGSINAAGTITANLFSGSLPYGDLTGTPTIPTNNNQLTNGAGYYKSGDSPTFDAITAAGDLTVNTDALFVDASTKRVGIGTSSADGPLQVGVLDSSGSLRAGLVVKTISNSQSNSEAAIYIEESSGGEGYYLRVDSDGGLAFDNSAGSPPALYLSDGNDVGIGTASPANRFEVASSSATKANFTHSSSNKTSLYIESDDTSARIGSTYYGSGGSFKPLAFLTSGTEAMRIDNSQSLLIGPSGAATTTITSAGWIQASNEITVDRTTGNVFRGKSNGTVTSTIDYQGAATFAGPLTTGAALSAGSGVNIYGGGSIYIQQDSAGSNDKLLIFKNGNSSEVASINGAGGATFSETVEIGTSGSAGWIKLYGPGEGSAAGRIMNAGCTLNESGAATFGDMANGWGFQVNTSDLSFRPPDANGSGSNAFVIYADGAGVNNKTASITKGGAATFAGNVVSGTDWNSGDGVSAYNGGFLYIRNDGESGVVFAIQNGGNGTGGHRKASITGDGAATFSGSITAAGYNLSSLPSLP